MKCESIQELFGDYWDLPADDHMRAQVDDHIRECAECAEQFNFWKESTELIQSMSKFEEPVAYERISNNVMDRIYSDESWRIPVHHRSYSFSLRLRRSATAIIAVCMALFICSFLYSVVYDTPDRNVQVLSNVSGLLPAASAVDDGGLVDPEFYIDVPTASISDPFVLKMTPTYPHYWVAVSLFGLIFALLIMNWLSRTKA